MDSKNKIHKPTEEEIKAAAQADFNMQTTYDNGYDRKKGFKAGALWMASEIAKRQKLLHKQEI